MRPTETNNLRHSARGTTYDPEIIAWRNAKGDLELLATKHGLARPLSLELFSGYVLLRVVT